MADPDARSSSSDDSEAEMEAKLAKMQADLAKKKAKKEKKEKKKKEKKEKEKKPKAAAEEAAQPKTTAAAETTAPAPATRETDQPVEPTVTSPLVETAKKLMTKEGNIYLYALTNGLATDRYNNVLTYFEHIYETGRKSLKLDDKQMMLLKAIVRLEIYKVDSTQQRLVAAASSSDLITAAGGLLDRKHFKTQGLNSVMPFVLKTIWPVWFVPPELLLANQEGKIDAAFLLKRKGSKTSDQVINFEAAIPHLLKLASASDEEIAEAAEQSVLPTRLFLQFWKTIRDVRADLDAGVHYVAQAYELEGFKEPPTQAATGSKAEVAALKKEYNTKKEAFEALQAEGKKDGALKAQLADLKAKIEAKKAALDSPTEPPSGAVRPKVLPAPWTVGFGIGDWAFCTAGGAATVPPQLSIWANRDTWRFIAHCSAAHGEILKPPKKASTKSASPSIITDSASVVNTAPKTAADLTSPHIVQMLESYGGRIQTDGRDFARALDFTPDMMVALQHKHFMAFGTEHPYFVSVAYPLRWFLHNVDEAEKAIKKAEQARLASFAPTTPLPEEKPKEVAAMDEEEAEDDEEEEAVDRMELDPSPIEEKKHEEKKEAAAEDNPTAEEKEKKRKDREEHARRRAEHQKKKEDKERRRKEKEAKKGAVAASLPAPSKSAADTDTNGGGRGGSKRSKDAAELSTGSVESAAKKPAKKKAKNETAAPPPPPSASPAAKSDAMEMDSPPAPQKAVETQPATIDELLSKLGSTNLAEIISIQDADAFQSCKEEADRLSALTPVHHFDPAYVMTANMPDEQALIELLDTLRPAVPSQADISTATLLRSVMLTMTAGSLIQQQTSAIRDTSGSIEELYESNFVDFLQGDKNVNDLTTKFVTLYGAHDVFKRVLGAPSGQSITALVK
jgi:hypothetical protein